MVIDSEVEAIKALVGRVDAAAASGRQAAGGYPRMKYRITGRGINTCPSHALILRHVTHVQKVCS